jgi:hypothetical protein
VKKIISVFLVYIYVIGISFLLYTFIPKILIVTEPTLENAGPLSILLIVGIIIVYIILSIPITFLLVLFKQKQKDIVGDKFWLVILFSTMIIICGPLTVSLSIQWLKYHHWGSFGGFANVLFCGILSAIVSLWGISKGLERE